MEIESWLTKPTCPKVKKTLQIIRSDICLSSDHWALPSSPWHFWLFPLQWPERTVLEMQTIYKPENHVTSQWQKKSLEVPVLSSKLIYFSDQSEVSQNFKVISSCSQFHCICLMSCTNITETHYISQNNRNSTWAHSGTASPRKS